LKIRSAVKEYNAQSKVEFEQIRDFLVLHYCLNEREDSDFWRDMRHLTLPDSLTHKMALFKQNGNLVREQNDLFLESSWLQVMYGQGLVPEDYHGLANSFSDEKTQAMLSSVYNIKREPIASLPTHDAYIQSMIDSANKSSVSF